MRTRSLMVTGAVLHEKGAIGCSPIRISMVFRHSGTTVVMPVAGSVVSRRCRRESRCGRAVYALKSTEYGEDFALPRYVAAAYRGTVQEECVVASWTINLSSVLTRRRRGIRHGDATASRGVPAADSALASRPPSQGSCWSGHRDCGRCGDGSPASDCSAMSGPLPLPLPAAPSTARTPLPSMPRAEHGTGDRAKGGVTPRATTTEAPRGAVKVAAPPPHPPWCSCVESPSMSPPPPPLAVAKGGCPQPWAAASVPTSLRCSIGGGDDTENRGCKRGCNGAAAAEAAGDPVAIWARRCAARRATNGFVKTSRCHRCCSCCCAEGAPLSTRRPPPPPPPVPTISDSARSEMSRETPSLKARNELLEPPLPRRRKADSASPLSSPLPLGPAAAAAAASERRAPRPLWRYD
eukprot:Rhum_TRINITY_DN14666_c15_g1::Rhum_TRINITY_DN14666_c15_g1_i1::g.107273::m.107273